MRYGSNHLVDYIELDANNAIMEVPASEHWAGKTVGDIDIRKKYGINLLGIKRSGTIDVNISSDTVLPADGHLLVLGEYRSIKRCFHL